MVYLPHDLLGTRMISISSSTSFSILDMCLLRLCLFNTSKTIASSEIPRAMVQPSPRRVFSYPNWDQESYQKEVCLSFHYLIPSCDMEFSEIPTIIRLGSLKLLTHQTFRVLRNGHVINWKKHWKPVITFSLSMSLPLCSTLLLHSLRSSTFPRFTKEKVKSNEFLLSLSLCFTATATDQSSLLQSLLLTP